MAAVTDRQLLLELSDALMIALARGRQYALMPHPGGGYLIIDLGNAGVH